MINNTYSYDKLKAQVKEELKFAITEGGKEALSEGIKEIMSQKLNAKNIKFDAKQLTKFIEDEIAAAMSNVDLNKTIKNINGIKLKDFVDLNESELKSKLQEINDIVIESGRKSDAKQLLGGLLTAKSMNIDYSELFNEKEFDDFINEYKFGAELIESITNELANYKPRNIDFVDVFIESLKELDIVKDKVYEFKDLYNLLNSYMENQPAGTRANKFWDELSSSFDNLDDKTKKLLQDLGLLNKEKDGINSIQSGANNKGGIIGDKNVVLTRNITDKTTPETAQALKKALDEVSESGVNCARILDIIHDKESNLFLEIQETASGSSISNIADGIDKINTDIFKATDEQIEKLISDLKILYDAGIEVDVENLSNILYDAKKGFSFIDLDLLDPDKEINGVKTSFSSFEEMLSSFIQTLRWQVDDINEILQAPKDAKSWDEFTNRVVSASENITKDALEAIRATQNSHSDAKETESLGLDFGGGFAKGIDESVDRVKKSTKNLVEEAKKELNINISDLFAEEYNNSPEIKESKINGNKRKIKRFVSKGVTNIPDLEKIYDDDHAIGVDFSDDKEIDIVEKKYKPISQELINISEKAKKTANDIKILSSALKDLENKSEESEYYSDSDLEKYSEDIMRLSSAIDESNSLSFNTSIIDTNNQIEESANKAREAEEKLHQEELNEEILISDSILEGLKQVVVESNKEKESIDNTTAAIINQETEYSTLYSKLVKIKELVNDGFSVLDIEYLDDDVLEELDKTLFSLSEKDLKDLGFKNTSGIIEDLKEIQERLHNTFWEFENNEYDDESFMDSGNLDEIFDSTTELDISTKKIKESADVAALSINNLLNSIQDINSLKFKQNVDTDLEIKSYDKNDEFESQTKSIKDRENIIEEYIDTQKVLEKEIKEDIKSTTESIDAEKQTIKNVEEMSKQSANSQISDYQRIKKEIQETQKEIYRLNELDEESNKIPRYVGDVYNEKIKKYSQLEDSDFDKKIQEKQSEGIRSKKHDFNVDIVSIKALIDEAQKRGKDLSFTSFIPNDIENIDKLQLAFEKISNYIASLNDTNYTNDSIIENLGIATRKLHELKTELDNIVKSASAVDKIDYEANKIIKSISEKRGSASSDNAKDLIRVFTSKGITDKNTILDQVKVFTDNKNIIGVVNKELNDMESKEKAIAVAQEEASKAIQEETQKLEQKNQQIKENIISQDALSKHASNNYTADNYSSINKGFNNEQNVVSLATTSEISSLEELKNKIINIREAIDAKTAAFEIEQHTVDFTTEEEIIVLDKLILTLKTIKTIIDEISSGFNNLSLDNVKVNIKTQGIADIFNLLKEDKLDTNLTTIYMYLDDFAKSVNKIDFNNNLVEDLNKLLSKSNELKNLAQILKSNKSSIESVSSKPEKSDSNELSKLENAYKTLISSEEKYQRLKSSEKLSVKQSGELTGLEIERKNALEIINSIGKETKKNTKYEQDYANEVERTSKILQAEKEASEKNNRSKLINNLQSQIDSLSKLEIAPKFTDEFASKITKEINDAKESLNGTDEEIESIIKHLKDFSKTIPKNALESSYTALNKNALDISDMLEKNTNMSNRLKNELLSMYKEIEKYKDTGLFEDKDLVRIKNRIIEIKDEISRTGQGGDSLAVSLKKQLSSLWKRDIARYLGLNDIIRYIKNISSTVTELDTALTELRKVSDASNERLQQSFQKSAETAKELGSSITNIINATADWSRLGFSVDDAEELAKVSQLYVNVGDNMTMEEANESLISTLQGFEMQAEEAEDIVDQFNEVANNYAIDTKGIGAALQRSAAAFNAANTDLSQSIALVTTANTIAQDPDKVGNAFVTLSARIRGSKSELEDLGEETDAYVESTSKLRDQVKATTGVDIMKDEKTYKDVYTILVEIGKVWKDLSDIDQAALLEALAGKRQSNILAGVLNNAELLEKVYKTASKDAEGSAQKEQENYEKSIQYSIDRLKATAQDLAQDFIKSDWIKSAVDGLNSILETVDELVESTGSLVPILTTIAGIIVSIKATQGISDIASTFKNLSGNKDKTLTLTDRFKNLFKVTGEGTGAFGTFAAKLGMSSAALGGIIAGVVAVTAVIYKLSKAQGEINKQASEAQQKYAESSKSINEYKTKIEELRAVSDDNTKSIEEQQSAREQLLTIQNEMVNKYGEEASQINILKGSVNELNLSFKKLSDTQYQEFLNDVNKEGFWKGLSNDIKGYSDNMDSIRAQMEEFSSTWNGSVSESEANKIIEKLNSFGVNASIREQTYNDQGTSYVIGRNIEVDNSNLQSYYDALLELQKEYENTSNENIKNLLRKEAESANKILTEISDAYNTYFEQEVIFDKYGEQVDSVTSSLQKLRDAQIGGDDSEIDKASKELAESYNKAMKEAAGNQSAINWFGELVSQYQSIIDQQNFIAKITPEFKEPNNDYKHYAGILKESEITKQELSNLSEGEYTLNGIAQNWSEEVAAAVSYIKETSEKENISIPFIIDRFEIDGAVVDGARQELISLIGEDTFSEFSQSEQEGLLGLSPQEIKNEVALWKRSYQEIGNEADTLSSKLRNIINKETSTSNFSQSEFSKSLDDLKKLTSLYETFKNNAANNKTKINLDISDVESLRDIFKNIVTDEEFDEFERIATSANSSATDIKNAFDKMATSFADSQFKLNGLNKETKEMVQNNLISAGFDEDSVKEYVDNIYEVGKAQEYVNGHGIKMAQIFEGDIGGSLDSLSQKSGYAKEVLIQLALTEIQTAVNSEQMDFSTAIANIAALAQEAGIAVSSLAALSGAMAFDASLKTSHTLQDFYNTEEKQNTARQAYMKNAMTEFQNEMRKGLEVSTGAAASGGGEAGDAYVQAFEKEYNKLKELLNDGIIDQREYLQTLNSLYKKYFANRKEYLEQFAKYEREYLTGMESLYSSAISGIQTILQHRIDDLNEQKDAAIKRLEEEKQAAMDAIQAEIDARQDEIDAIREANDERDRELDLMQKKYDLERMMNQNTRLIYREGEGMVYDQDTSGIRDARNAVDDAVDEMKIAELEKEIDNLQDQLEETEKYYDDLIKKTEEMFDKQISGLEKIMKKWAELAEIKELAEAWNAIGMTAEDLGYSIEDLLNGNEHAFEDFKARYLGILSDLNAGNEYYQQGLEVFGNTSVAQMDHITGAMQTAVTTMSNTLSNVDFSNLSAGLETAGATIVEGAQKIGLDVTDKLAEGMKDTESIAEAANVVGDNVESELRTALQTHSPSDRTKPIGKDVVDGVRDGMIENATDVNAGSEAVATAIETSLNASLGNIGDSIEPLNNLNINTENIDAATASFTALGSAIQGVNAALGGGGGVTEVADGEAGMGTPLSTAATDAGGGASTGGIAGAINAIKTATDTALGTADSEDGAIGAFTALGEAINADTAALGGSTGGGEGNGEDKGGKQTQSKSDSSKGEGEGEGGGSGLKGAIEDVGSTTAEIIGEEANPEGGTVIGDFVVLDGVLEEASAHVNKIRTDLEEMDGKTYTVKVQIVIEGAGVGSAVSRAVGSATKGLKAAGKKVSTSVDYGGLPQWIIDGGGVEGKTKTYEAHYGQKAMGSAMATGDWRVHRGGKTLVGELGQEIVIRDGKYFTVGDHGAEFVNLRSSDIVLNHKQTREILSGRNQVSQSEVDRKMNDKAFQKAVSRKMGSSRYKGRALATGTLGDLRQLTPDESAIFNLMAGIRTDLTTNLIPDVSDIKETIKTVNNVKSINNSPIINMTNTFECNGVTVEQVKDQISSAFSGMAVTAYQNVMKR